VDTADVEALTPWLDWAFAGARPKASGLTAPHPAAPMRLRPATPGDLALLRRWDAEPHLAGTGGDAAFNDWDWEVGLGRTPFLARVADRRGRRGAPRSAFSRSSTRPRRRRTTGATAGREPARDRHLDRRADAIGRGHGRRMMEEALRRCFADPAVTAVLVDPMADNTRAHRFYEALGFAFAERRSFGPDDCFVYILERRRWRLGD
jgi:aminoglycoside 6'-N-acetyltransferase